MGNKLVFSTSKAVEKKSKKNQDYYTPADGPMKMRLESKGRGGKEVTVLFNLPFSESEAKTFKRDIQNFLACGATFKNNQIELRGDLRSKVEAYCANKGMKVVRAGGQTNAPSPALTKTLLN